MKVRLQWFCNKVQIIKNGAKSGRISSVLRLLCCYGNFNCEIFTKIQTIYCLFRIFLQTFGKLNVKIFICIVGFIEEKVQKAYLNGFYQLFVRTFCHKIP